MSTADVTYVEITPEAGYRLAGSRITLDSVVLAYLDGKSPEAIQDGFPSLPLETIHGAIAFYLHNRNEIDDHLKKFAARRDELRQASERENSALLARLRSERKRSSTN